MYTPKLALYHPKNNGTGTAIVMELRPAHGTENGTVDGAIFFKIANQKTLGSCHTYPTFNWADAVTVKMDFTDLSQMLQVFRGEREDINDAHALYHRTAREEQVIRFNHLLVDEHYAYDLAVTAKGNDPGAEEQTFKFSFTSAEALGLCEAIAGSMSCIAFGTGFEQTSIALATDEAKKAAAKESKEE